MTRKVVCKQCGSAVEDKPADKPEQRVPCPVCGSKSRTFSSYLEQRLHLGGDLTIEVFSVANLLIQTVITPGSKTNEGQLIQAVALPWFEIIKLLVKDPSLAYRIDARKWEEIIAGAYKLANFDDVTLTPRSGDFGRDVIAVKKGLGTVRVIDQVKAYTPGHLVTADDVRALLGVLQGDGASKGFLTTTSDFAPKLRDDILLKPFMPSRIELVNGDMLQKRLAELAAQGKQ